MSRFGDLVSGKPAAPAPAAPAAPEPAVAPSVPAEPAVQPVAEEKVIDLSKRRKSRKSK